MTNLLFWLPMAALCLLFGRWLLGNRVDEEAITIVEDVPDEQGMEYYTRQPGEVHANYQLMAKLGKQHEHSMFCWCRPMRHPADPMLVLHRDGGTV